MGRGKDKTLAHSVACKASKSRLEGTILIEKEWSDVRWYTLYKSCAFLQEQ